MSSPPRGHHLSSSVKRHPTPSSSDIDYSRNGTRSPEPSKDSDHDSRQSPPPRPPHPGGRPMGIPSTSRHNSPSTLGYGRPPPVSPEHAKARAETLQRTLRTSPKTAQPELATSSIDDIRSASASYQLREGSNRETRRQSPMQPSPPYSSRQFESNAHSSHPPATSPRSLSVFNAPTATFMWPGFQASSQMNAAPKIYVDYDRNKSSNPGRYPSGSRPFENPSSTRASAEEPTMTLPQKRRPSADLPYDDSRRPDPATLSTILEPFKTIRIGEPKTSLPEPSSSDTRGLFHVDEQSRPQSAPAYREHLAEHDVLKHHEFEPTLEKNYIAMPRSAPPQATPTILSPSLPKPEEEWEAYAQPIKLPDGSQKWQCYWRTMDDGAEVNCNYVSKKQLVKRHVETTHLKYKPFACEVCGKKFPQKTSLDTHMHGHTGQSPHECRFGCGQTFKDPARRHRHMVDDHGYVPRPSQRRQKSGQGPSEPSEFESMTPWTLKK